MGRWMKALNKEGKIILEIVPNFLIYCSRNLPKQIKNDFPILFDLDVNSSKWVDELQILNLNEVEDLNQELSKVRRILNLEEFIPKVDSKKIMKYWTTEEYKLNDINEDIDFFISFFNKTLVLELEIKVYL